MVAVEIATKVTANGDVIIPRAYTKDIPAGSTIRVVILWEEWVEPGQQYAKAKEDPLTAFIARIQGHPLLPAYTPTVDKILVQDWANEAEEVTEDFDPDAWNRTWDKLEAELEAEEDAHQEQTLQEIHKTIQESQL